MNELTRPLSWLVISICLAACSSPANDVIARFDGGVITVDQFGQHLLRLPSEQRAIPPGVSSDAWMETQLRKYSLAVVLAQTPEASTLATLASTRTQQLIKRGQLLNQLLIAQLSEKNLPTVEAIEAEAERLAAQATTEEIFDFQHVTLPQDDNGASLLLASEIVERARAGADFSSLARQNSTAANAADGGLIQRARLVDLDQPIQAALNALQDGEISEPISSRSGIHVLRMVRRLQPEAPSKQRLLNIAQQTLQQQALGDAVQALLDELKAKRTDYEEPWSLGGKPIDSEMMALLLPDEATDLQRDAFRDSMLLAQEAEKRGLLTDEMSSNLAYADHIVLLELVFQKYRDAFDLTLDESDLRLYYDAQPGLFSTAAKTDLDLLFLPQGTDAYSTALQAKTLVAELRSGTSFAELARQHSQGPNAADGGALGKLSAAEINRLNAALVSAVAAIPVGAIGEPIYLTDRTLSNDPELLRGGFAIARVNDREQAETRSFEDAIGDVRRQFALANRESLDEQLMEQILGDVQFQIVRLPEPAEILQ